MLPFSIAGRLTATIEQGVLKPTMSDNNVDLYALITHTVQNENFTCIVDGVGMSNPKRAMWLMNHSTLRKFEVPLLESLGYEVYLPKIFPYDEGNLSASLDFSRDDKLSIPMEDLESLNHHDFYSGMTPEIGEIASKHFDIAFFGFFPDQLAGLIRHFRNTIIMRPFGLSAGDCYTNITAATLGPSFMHELEERRKDFFVNRRTKVTPNRRPNLTPVLGSAYEPPGAGRGCIGWVMRGVDEYLTLALRAILKSP